MRPDTWDDNPGKRSVPPYGHIIFQKQLYSTLYFYVVRNARGIYVERRLPRSALLPLVMNGHEPAIGVGIRVGDGTQESHTLTPRT